jgi:protein disulfide-isomerase
MNHCTCVYRLILGLVLLSGVVQAEEPKAPGAGAQAPDAQAKDPVWQQDLKAATAEAKKTHRVLLLDFTGSDWCGWCMKLKAEVFDQQAFKDYAAKNLVLVEVDFPKRKELPAEVKKQNAALAQKYKIQGYPTIILLSATGKVLGETGYQEGGPEKYVEMLKGLTKKK